MKSRTQTAEYAEMPRSQTIASFEILRTLKFHVRDLSHLASSSSTSSLKSRPFWSREEGRLHIEVCLSPDVGRDLHVVAVGPLAASAVRRGRAGSGAEPVLWPSAREPVRRLGTTDRAGEGGGSSAGGCTTRRWGFAESLDPPEFLEGTV